MPILSFVIDRFKLLLFIILILPSIIWFFMFLRGTLGVNPIDQLMDEFGKMGLRLIIFTLIISSIAEIKYFRALQKIRRMVGLFAFYYVLVHFLIYIILDHFFNWGFIVKDIIKRPFISLGFISFVLLMPLAFTSIDIVVKKLTYKVWKNIHKLIYISAFLASMHFFLLKKADKTEPTIYLIIIFILFLSRAHKIFFLKKR